MPDIEAIVDQAFAGDAEAAPLDTGTDSADAGTVEGQAGEQAAQQGTQAEETFSWDNVPEEVLPHVKHFQADYTRKMQTLAEERKSFEAQAQQFQAYAALEQLAAQDPQMAAEILRRRADLIAGGAQAATSETDPLDAIEPMTETEQLLLAELRQVKAQQAQFQQFHQQTAQQQGMERLNSAFAQLEQAIGRSIPHDEREQVAGYCMERGIRDPIDGFRSMNWEKEMARMRQTGRDEAGAVVQQKAAAPPPPSGLANRSSGVKELPKDRKLLIGDIYDQQMRG